jgi:hypothetical protein
VDALGFDNDDPVISQSFTRHGNEHNVSEHIAINIDRLEAGYYEMLVK